MKEINLLIGILPYIIVAFHILMLLFDYKHHKTILIRLVGNVICSKMLKMIFGIKRHKIIKKDVLYHLRRFVDLFDTGHTFPSSHVMFYTSYFLREFSIIRIVFVLFSCFGRVVYKHHSIRDVAAGVIFGLVYNFLTL